ncbi:MAG: hypothetical protein ACR652_22595 [Methylocystis sp.]|uniref:hypothetical protein n=1 Tax=Methylocystis sp. TaxID=1911079 RepID=UPI003DA509BD
MYWDPSSNTIHSTQQQDHGSQNNAGLDPDRSARVQWRQGGRLPPNHPSQGQSQQAQEYGRQIDQQLARPLRSRNVAPQGGANVTPFDDPQAPQTSNTYYQYGIPADDPYGRAPQPLCQPNNSGPSQHVFVQPQHHGRHSVPSQPVHNAATNLFHEKGVANFAKRTISAIASGSHPRFPLSALYPQDEGSQVALAYIQSLSVTLPKISFDRDHAQTFAQALASRKELTMPEVEGWCVKYVQQQAASFLDVLKAVARAAQQLPRSDEENRICFEEIARQAPDLLKSVDTKHEAEKIILQAYVDLLASHMGNSRFNKFLHDLD